MILVKEEGEGRKVCWSKEGSIKNGAALPNILLLRKRARQP